MNYQPSDMTHDELAEHAMKVGTATSNDALWSAAYDLQDAVNKEEDSEELASLVLSLLGVSQTTKE